MKTPILAAALAATSLFGQGAGQDLEKRVEIFGEYTRPRQIVWGNASGGDIQDRALFHKYSGGVRLMGEFPGTQGWYFSLGGRLESTSTMDFAGFTGGGHTLDTTDLSIRYSYWMVGVSNLVPLNNGFTFGGHIEARGEAIGAVGDVFIDGANAGSVNQSTTYLRPWIRASLDWTWKRPGVSPYIGADLAMPLMRTTQSRSVSPLTMDSNTLKAMAPSAAASVYVGLRF